MKVGEAGTSSEDGAVVVALAALLLLPQALLGAVVLQVGQLLLVDGPTPLPGEGSGGMGVVYFS